MNTEYYEQLIMPQLTKAEFFYAGDSRCHIVAIFEDDDNVLAAYKEWSKHKQQWIYKIEHVWLMGYSFKHGGYTWKREG